jgi:hypothetical protein
MSGSPGKVKGSQAASASGWAVALKADDDDDMVYSDSAESTPTAHQPASNSSATPTRRPEDTIKVSGHAPSGQGVASGGAKPRKPLLRGDECSPMEVSRLRLEQESGKCRISELCRELDQLRCEILSYRSDLQFAHGQLKERERERDEALQLVDSTKRQFHLMEEQCKQASQEDAMKRDTATHVMELRCREVEEAFEKFKKETSEKEADLVSSIQAAVKARKCAEEKLEETRQEAQVSVAERDSALIVIQENSERLAEQNKRIQEQSESIKELENKLQTALEKLEQDAVQTAIAREELTAVETRIKRSMQQEEEKMIRLEEELRQERETRVRVEREAAESVACILADVEREKETRAASDTVAVGNLQSALDALKQEKETWTNFMQEAQAELEREKQARIRTEEEARESMQRLQDEWEEKIGQVRARCAQEAEDSRQQALSELERERSQRVDAERKMKEDLDRAMEELARERNTRIELERETKESMDAMMAVTASADESAQRLREERDNALVRDSVNVGIVLMCWCFQAGFA